MKSLIMQRSQKIFGTLLATSSLIAPYTLWLIPPARAQVAALCATPGRDGSPGALGGVVNTYYPGAGNPAAGATSIPVGAPTGGAPIAAGDLLLIIQMQGATINSANTDTYGDGAAGGSENPVTINGPQQPNLGASGVTGTPIAGNYEFVVATGAVAAGVVPIQSRGAGNGLLNSYTNAAATATQGQQTYQVIRVPQYLNATLGTPTAQPWNGSTGGIIAIDVANVLDATGTAEVSGRGFRGGGGRQLNGDGTLNNNDFRALSSLNANGSKGEGIAGTPRFFFDSATNTTIDNGVANEGYPDGSYGRGAPGNAGGGSTDGDPGNNQQNSGGGGGANGGIGGIGGRGWTPSGYNPPTILGFATGGYGGSPYTAATGRLIMGGGGGAGTTNDGTGGLANGAASSGSAGGGMVFLRTNTITNTGIINANGANALNTEQDGAGGGGAGGSVLITALSGSTAGLTINANGGNGGSALFDQPHGPGGGGGGGAIFATPGATFNRAGGANGLTRPANPISLDAVAGDGTLTPITLGVVPGANSGAECLVPVVGLTKRLAGTPTDNGNGTFTLNYDLTVSNRGLVALANVQIAEDLSTTYGAVPFTVNSVTVTGGTALTVNSAYTGTAANPNLLAASQALAVGASSTIRINLTVTPGANLGPYNNNATATAASAVDPTRTTSDTSQNDVGNTGNPDPDGDGNTANNNDPTPVTFTNAAPVIGVAKQAGTPVNNNNGTFTIPYTLVVRNYGPTVLNNVQITEDLSGTYGAPATFTAQAPAGTGITANTTFTGTAAGSTNLLAAGQTLAIGASATITFNVIVTPNGNLGPYNNSAIATGTSPAGITVTDTSDDDPTTPGAPNPDPNGNNNPGDPGEDTPTTTTIPADPRLGVSKRLVSQVNNGDGSFNVQYELTVQNFGNVPLSNLQVTDNLATTYAGATSFSVVSAPTSATLTGNVGFNGAANTNLLSGTNTLAVNQSGTINFTVRVVPGANLGPYQNTAVGNGTPPAGAPVTDNSTNGTNPDANGNGNPNDDEVPTPVNFAEIPRIGLAKQVVSTVNNGNGSYTVTYNLALSNLGSVPLSNVQVVENLATTFTGATSFAVSSVAVPNGGLTANAGFNGTGNNNLLAAGQSLALGGTASIRLVVTVTPGSNLGPYNNSATANGTSPAGTGVTDISDDGTNPDPNNNGDPSEPGENDPTPLLFTETPLLGVAKQVGTVVNNGDGTFTVPYIVTVQNLGNVEIRNVQLVEDLFGTPSSTFNSASAIALATPPTFTSGPLTAANAGFNGNSDKNLLAGTQTLAVGQRSTLTFSVRVTPGANLGPFNNIVTATGSSPSNQSVSDQSVDQTNQANPSVDPDGNGNPGNDTSPTVVSFSTTPRLRLVKRITAATRNGTAIAGVNFSQFVNNSADAAALNSAGLAPIGVLEVPTSNPLRSGDEVEYTVYFLSDGGAPALDVNLCDQVPNSTTLIANSNQVRSGSAAPTAGGTVFSPLQPLPANNSCQNQTNANGSVIFSLGNVSSTSGSNTGFVRFRVRLN